MVEPSKINHPKTIDMARSAAQGNSWNSIAIICISFQETDKIDLMVQRFFQLAAVAAESDCGLLARERGSGGSSSESPPASLSSLPSGPRETGPRELEERGSEGGL